MTYKGRIQQQQHEEEDLTTAVYQPHGTYGADVCVDDICRCCAGMQQPLLECGLEGCCEVTRKAGVLQAYCQVLQGRLAVRVVNDDVKHV